MSAGELILDDRVGDMSWVLNERQGVRMQHSGFSQVTMMAEPFWSFELSTKWLDVVLFRKWTAWLARRKGSAVTFTAWRMQMPYGAVPVANDTGLTVTDYDRAASTVSFGGTGTWTATEGDMLSYYTEAGGYWCGQALETKAAAGGNMTDLAVYPPPFEPHATTANPRRIRALAEFQLLLPVPAQIERVEERFISFSASQIIRG